MALRSSALAEQTVFHANQNVFISVSPTCQDPTQQEATVSSKDTIYKMSVNDCRSISDANQESARNEIWRPGDKIANLARFEVTGPDGITGNLTVACEGDRPKLVAADEFGVRRIQTLKIQATLKHLQKAVGTLCRAGKPVEAPMIAVGHQIFTPPAP